MRFGFFVVTAANCDIIRFNLWVIKLLARVYQRFGKESTGAVPVPESVSWLKSGSNEGDVFQYKKNILKS